LQYLLQLLQPILDQVVLVFRGLDAVRGFFLKRMNHPKLFPDLHRIDHAERIATLAHCNLKYSRPGPFHRLGYSSLAALGGDAQRIDHYFARSFRKSPEGFSCLA
jgi:hypothetical protein